MVFQKPTPFPMTIYDNIAFGIKLYERMPRSELDGRIETALQRAALWGEVKDKLKDSGLSLSGGQQQRLCIARTVATKPEVILLDEPCSALDPISTAKIEELIDELSAEYTIVIVTHNMQQASRASDYTAFMYLGELIEYGPTEKIFTAPDNKRTEQYITGRLRLGIVRAPLPSSMPSCRFVIEAAARSGQLGDECAHDPQIASAGGCAARIEQPAQREADGDVQDQRRLAPRSTARSCRRDVQRDRVEVLNADLRRHPGARCRCPPPSRSASAQG